MFPERIQQIQFGTGRSTGSFSVHHLTPYEHSNGQRPRHRSEKRRESILLPAGRKHRKIHPVPKKTVTLGGRSPHSRSTQAGASRRETKPERGGARRGCPGPRSRHKNWLGTLRCTSSAQSAAPVRHSHPGSVQFCPDAPSRGGFGDGGRRGVKKNGISAFNKISGETGTDSRTTSSGIE